MFYNCKVIDYGDTLHVEFFNKGITREEEKPIDELKENIINDIEYEQLSLIERTKEEEERCLKVSANRSKNKLYRIARSNSWEYFITLTFNPDLVDRTDFKECQKKVQKYFNNLKSRGNPDLKYLIVPELHKDGVSYHFHGLIANCPNLNIVDSGHTDFLDNKIFNLDSWHFGFSTASLVKDSKRVSFYIGKYITKDLIQQTKGQHRYSASKNCNVNPEQYYNINYNELLKHYADDILYMKSVNCPSSGQVIKYIEINNKKEKE